MNQKAPKGFDEFFKDNPKRKPEPTEKPTGNSAEPSSPSGSNSNKDRKDKKCNLILNFSKGKSAI
jgi:hypothetical protein